MTHSSSAVVGAPAAGVNNGGGQVVWEQDERRPGAGHGDGEGVAAAVRISRGLGVVDEDRSVARQFGCAAAG